MPVGGVSKITEKMASSKPCNFAVLEKIILILKLFLSQLLSQLFCC
nr:MAG TPA: hypothetical protein [Caudoviricetes sp.]